MSWLKSVLIAVPVVMTAALIHPQQAEACGGCFVPPEESTQVTGHRMILSVSKTQSTLYDQIEYSGDPAEFAWVLPTKGIVDVGLSSDLIFNQLGVDTGVQVLPPPINCPALDCGYDELAQGGPSSAEDSNGTGGGGVTVLASAQVGPYETVQLQATDPAALNTWLDQNGFNIPNEIQPIINSYVAESFNFLAMKLIPGVGVERMQPVRITTPGASPVLPLRMVAAGTGAITTMTLWVIAEGRYETTNFPSFSIPEKAVVWNFDTSSSNYDTLRQSAYAASNNFGWLTESARGYSPDNFTNNIMNVVWSIPEQSGYDDGTGDYELIQQAAEDDLAVLFAGIDPATAHITRMRAELSRDALGDDLLIGAAADQGDVSNFVQTTKWVGTVPACPSDCGGNSFDNPDIGGGSSGGGKGCAFSVDGRQDSGLAAGLFLALGLVVARRRRKQA